MASENVENAFAWLRAEGFTVAAKECPVLSIDAWNGPEGWTWNAWYRIASVPLYVCALKPRALLAYLRDAGILGAQSGGRCAIEDDGYNVVILDRSNRMPVFALAYGECEE